MNAKRRKRYQEKKNSRNARSRVCRAKTKHRRIVDDVSDAASSMSDQTKTAEQYKFDPEKTRIGTVNGTSIDIEDTKEFIKERFNGIDTTFEALQDILDNDIAGNVLFDDMLKDPTKAILLHYLNSGCFGFQRWKEYSSQFANTIMSEQDKRALRSEILDEMLTDKETKDILTEFFTCHNYAERRLLSCGACGIREWERPRNPEVKFQEVVIHPDTILAPL